MLFQEVRANAAPASASPPMTEDPDFHCRRQRLVHLGIARARRSAPSATYVKCPSVTFTVPLSSWRRAQASTYTVTLVFPTWLMAQ